MRRLIIALTLAGLLTLATAVPAFAGGPAGHGPKCSDPNDGASQAGHANENGKANWFGSASVKCAGLD